MNKNKPSAFQAWKLLMASMFKGIAAFVTIVVGLSVSLPLSIFLIGLPLLAETLVLGRRLMEAESCKVVNWRMGVKKKSADMPAARQLPQREWKGWRNLIAELGQARSYRSIAYGLLQLPIGIAAFTMVIVLPVTAWAVMLSPLAQQASLRLFSYDLFAEDILMTTLLPTLTGFERSWVAAGIGAVLVLLMPSILRGLGRLYASWIMFIAGSPAEPAEMPRTENKEAFASA